MERSISKKRVLERRLAKIEEQMVVLQDFANAHFKAIGDELRRAEARDEWMATQLTDVRRSVRALNKLVDELKAAAKNSSGFY